MIKLNQKQKEELERCAKASNDKDEIRKSQTILLLDEKNGLKLVKRLIGYGKTQAYTIKKRYLKEGIPSLSDKRKGKPKELLTKQQREEIIETVKTKRPKDCGYEREHWITSILGDWISRNFKVKYKSKTSLYLVFKQAQFTYHKPGRVYDKHDETEVAQWKTENEPKIRKYWKQKDTIILCADEMILTTETTIQRVWLPEGEFPKITCSTGGRKRRNVYGFLNLKTGQEHAFKTEYQNMYQTSDILKKIRTIYPNQNIILLWDNAGWHKGSVVQACIKEDKRIIQIPFPRYAPEENPQEHVWKQGRSQCTHNRFIENIDEATDELVTYFNETLFPYSLFGLSASPIL